jgi:hypothetical protein
MTLWEGIKLYPKAIGWSMLIRYVKFDLRHFPATHHFGIYRPCAAPPVRLFTSHHRPVYRADNKLVLRP